MLFQKHWFIPLGLFLTLLSGCSSVPPKLVDLKTGSKSLHERVMTLRPAERREAYDENRLTWEGRSVSVGRRWVAREELADYLGQVGAEDLSQKIVAAKPGILIEGPSRSARTHKGQGLVGRVGDRVEPGNRPSPERPSGAWAWLNLFSAWPAMTTTVSPVILGAAIGTGALGAAGVGVAGAFSTTQALLKGLDTELEQKPTLEALLEAYNQRLAYSLRLDHKDIALTTSMPRKGSMFQYSARDQSRLRTLVKSGLGASVACLGLASSYAMFEWSQQRSAPAWGSPAFMAGLGALVGNMILGANFVW